VLGSSEDFHDRYLLNIGLENGVQKGNAIVDSNGLIGKITDVSDKSSTIQLITSNDSKVPISILGTHYRGVAAGTYKDGYLKLLYLPEEAEVNEGQIVVTSGAERYIPHGIYIGKIVKQDKEIYVEVAKNDDKNLSMVSVLKLEDNFADARKKPK
jgi:rod shape-determining protein MreC